MIREIIQAPDDRLTQPSIPVQVEHLKEVLSGAIVRDLIDTRIHHAAAGLAAVQIGVALRVVATSPIEFLGFTLLVNPEIVDRGREVVTEDEGCVSIGVGKQFFKIARHRIVTVVFLDRLGAERIVTVKGFAARLAQHEIDHLDGKLIA